MSPPGRIRSEPSRQNDGRNDHNTTHDCAPSECSEGRVRRIGARRESAGQG